MEPLVSLGFVKQALRIAEQDGDGVVLPHEDDDVITVYIQEVQGIVLRYLRRDDDAWTDATAPRAVKTAIVLGVQSLYDPDQREILSGLGSSDPKNPLVGILCLLRKPTVA